MTLHQTELAKQSQHYADVRRRLMGLKQPRQKPAPVIDIRTESEEEIAETEIAFSTPVGVDKALVEAEVPKDYESLLKQNAALRAALIVAGADISMLDVPRRPVKEIVSEVLVMFNGIRWVDIRSNRRISTIVAAKHACIWEVYVQRPDLSSCQIGRIFGIDHSTVNYVVRSKEASFGDDEAAAVLKRKRQRSKDFYDNNYRKTAVEA